MKRILVIAICLAVLALACRERYAQTNDDRAYFVRDGDAYRVVMRGRRLPLVHDPVSLLLIRTYDETFTMQLPRIDGLIQASEIPVPGEVRYVGRVVIDRGTMTVDLYYDDVDEGTRRPLRWNDEYTLVERDTR